MNQTKLNTAAQRFLERYPNGFQHPELLAIGKKHKVEKRVELARASFAKQNFSAPDQIVENMVKLISQSSMVSMFEKPKFRDMAASANEYEILQLAEGLKHFLHGKQQQGFETLVDTLSPHKLAKWSLITIIPNYYHPDDEVFIKPTTAKGVIDFFELKDLVYKPQPTWAFYKAYRDTIIQMRSRVDPSLAPNNAAFCGFLMMSI